MHDQILSTAEQVVPDSGGSRGIDRAVAAGFAECDARAIYVDGEFSAGWSWPIPE